MSRTKVTVEPLAEEIHNSRCMVAGALDSFKTNIARHIISKLSCSPEAARTLTSEIEILCSARAIMHRKVDCSRPCDSSEWFGGKYNVDFYAYVFAFDVPLYVTITGSRMVSRYGKDDAGALMATSTTLRDLVDVELDAVIVEHTWNYTHFIPWIHSPKRRRIDSTVDTPGSTISDSGWTEIDVDLKTHFGEHSNKSIAEGSTMPLARSTAELESIKVDLPSGTSSSIPSADSIRIFRERVLHLVHTVISGRRKGGRGRSTTVDTARLVFAREVVLPELYFGKFPSDIDTRMLFASHPADLMANDVKIIPVKELEGGSPVNALSSKC